MERARDAIRQTRVADPKERPYSVLVRGGLYPLRETLVFRYEDSGTESAPITYAAYPGERPVLSGGRVVRGWQKSDEALWRVEIPEVRAGRWYPRQLFVNGQRRTRARFPNEGFLRSDGPPRFGEDAREVLAARMGKRSISFMQARALGKFGFRYKTGDVLRWRNLADVTLHIMHAWTSAVHWIGSLDQQRRTVRFTGPSRFPASHFERQMPYFVENVAEGLDAPGEWYVDRKTGVLTYWPMHGEDLGTAGTVVSVLKQLVRLEGEARAGVFVEGLTFRGLSFQHADWGPLDREAENDGFSSVHFLDAAIVAHAARHCVFEQCEIARCGGYGMYLIDGTAFNRLQQCHLHDLGGGGVLIGCRWSPYGTYKQPLPPDDAPECEVGGHNTVDNCFIQSCGQVFFGVIGVFVAHSPHNAVTHNEICDLPYSGVAVGRRLDYKHSHAHHNTVASNHIHHLGSGVMSDMAGIYTEGISPGTRLHHNLIHDVNHYRYGAWGLYCDQASSHIFLDHNICYNCMDGGYMQNVGTDNVVRNNIFALNRRGAQISNGRRTAYKAPVDSMTIERNIIVTTNGEVLGYHWNKDDEFRFDRNLYWKPSGVELKFKEWTWEQWQAMGQDAHSLIADPLFVDSDRYDFRLQPESPAGKIGFEPIDMSKVGLYGSAEWVAGPTKLTFRPFEAMSPPPPDRIDDDFEAMLAGEMADGATTFGETKKSSIRVTDETAASGKYSLKFVDAPGLPKSYWPWLGYKPKVSGATARFSFDLRLGRGAAVLHEWRTGGSPYQVGPSIAFVGGAVEVAKRTLLHLPFDRWIRIEILSPVREDSNGTFEMTITDPGGEPKRFRGLPFVSDKHFAELRWLGFIGVADANTAFYIDNIRLDTEPQ